MHLPAEWERHSHTWMGFPRTTYGASTSLTDARTAWANVARAIAPFEPVRMVVHPENRDEFTALLGDVVEPLFLEIDDAWLRDTGPTFVVGDGELIAVDWTFNGWGGQAWASWSHDARVARAIAEFQLPSGSIVHSPLVNEGGGIEVDGAGLLVLTETVQLDPGRNPGWSRDDVAREMSAQLGTDEPIWIPHGLAGDYGEFATRGHVDLVVKFCAPGIALVHHQENPDHPDFGYFSVVEKLLKDRGVEVIALPGPKTVTVDDELCDWSYVNCTLVNGGLIVGTYDDPADDRAMEILSEAFKGRTIIPVDARTLFSLGGGVHCITQQVPQP